MPRGGGYWGGGTGEGGTGEGGYSDIKRRCSSYLLGCSASRPTAGAFAVSFRVSNWKTFDRTRCVVLELVPLKGSGHAHQTKSWYLLRVLFNIFHEHLRPFYMNVPAPGLRHQPWLYPSLRKATVAVVVVITEKNDFNF